MVVCHAVVEAVSMTVYETVDVSYIDDVLYTVEVSMITVEVTVRFFLRRKTDESGEGGFGVIGGPRGFCSCSWLVFGVGTWVVAVRVLVTIEDG